MDYNGLQEIVSNFFATSHCRPDIDLFQELTSELYILLEKNPNVTPPQIKNYLKSCIKSYRNDWRTINFSDLKIINFDEDINIEEYISGQSIAESVYDLTTKPIRSIEKIFSSESTLKMLIEKRNDGYSLKELSACFGVTESSIQKILVQKGYVHNHEYKKLTDYSHVLREFGINYGD